MTIRDLNANVQPMQSLAPAATTTDRTAAAGVSLAGAESFMAVVHVGAVTTLNDTDKLTLSILTGDDATGSGAVAIDSGSYIGPRREDGEDWARVLDATFDDASMCYQVGFLNLSNHAYAFAKLTKAGSPSAIVGVNITRGNLRESPNAA